MPRMLTPAIKRSDALAAERSRTSPLDYWPDASFAEARSLAAHDAQIDESRFIGDRAGLPCQFVGDPVGEFWAYAEPEGVEDEGHRADAAAFREGR